jgi:hypothetical protein
VQQQLRWFASKTQLTTIFSLHRGKITIFRKSPADLETASTNAPSAQATWGIAVKQEAGCFLAILRRKLPRADLTLGMSD